MVTGTPPPGLARPLSAYAFESITVSTTAVGFTAATMLPASQPGPLMAKVSIETQAVRYRDDGTAPTATVGHQIAAAGEVYVSGPSLGRFRMIATAAGDATARVTYYR